MAQGRVHPHVRAASDSDPGIKKSCLVLAASYVVASPSSFQIHNLTPGYITPCPYSNEHTLTLVLGPIVYRAAGFDNPWDTNECGNGVSKEGVWLGKRSALRNKLGDVRSSEDRACKIREVFRPSSRQTFSSNIVQRIIPALKTVRNWSTSKTGSKKRSDPLTHRRKDPSNIPAREPQNYHLGAKRNLLC